MQNAAVGLRILTPRPLVIGTDDGEALENINTSELPDGAMCYVIADNTTYRLHKNLSVLSTDSSAVKPGSGPGAWVPEASLFVVSVQASPGTVTGNSSTTQSLVPTGTLRATDILFGTSLGNITDVPSGFVITPRIDTTTVPGTVRVQVDFVNATTGDKTIADNLHYYMLVWRPFP